MSDFPRIIIRGARLTDVVSVPGVLRQFTGNQIGIRNGQLFWNPSEPGRHIYVYRVASAVVVAFTYTDEAAT